MTFVVARHGSDWWARWAWLSGPAFAAGLVLHSGPYLRLVDDPVLPAGLPLLVWGVARLLHKYEVQRTQLVAARDTLDAEQELREEAAVSDERARIAADMHDVVAHAVSLMVVQVGAARMSMEGIADEQVQLRAAERTGRQALTDLRRSLGVLRPGAARARPGPAVPVPDDPAPPGRSAWLRDAALAVAFALVAILESVRTSFDAQVEMRYLHS